MKKIGCRIGIIILLLLIISIAFFAHAAAEEMLSFPTVTETDCIWDQNGNLTSETAYDLEGRPAINSRGFHRALYTWDDHGNLLSEAYYGLDGNLTVIDKGYARTEYTYYESSRHEYNVLTEDRYDAEGNRADIQGEYSYRRDYWENDNIIYSKYYNAQGHLTRPSGGYAQILCDYVTDDNNIITVTKRYLDSDGAPLIGVEGG